jgi:hypothetical protein
MAITVPAVSGFFAGQLTLNWTDDAGQETWQGPPLAASAVPPYAYFNPIPTFTFRANAGTPITYSVDPFSTFAGTYDLFFTVEQLR